MTFTDAACNDAACPCFDCYWTFSSFDGSQLIVNEVDPSITMKLIIYIMHPDEGGYVESKPNPEYVNKNFEITYTIGSCNCPNLEVKDPEHHIILKSIKPAQDSGVDHEESELLKDPEIKPFVQRIGSKLVVKTNVKDSVYIFVDKFVEATCPDMFCGEKYTLLSGYNDVFLIQQTSFDMEKTISFILIDKKSGAKSEQNSPPIFSPDNKRFITYSGYEPWDGNILNVYIIALTPQGLKEEFAFTNEQVVLFESVEWLSDKEIVLKQMDSDAVIHIKWDGVKWSLIH